jgi:DMSO/TMAO reductase YedYZ heme-binding membrane subunit
LAVAPRGGEGYPPPIAAVGRASTSGARAAERRAAIAWDLAVLALANGDIVVGLWWRQGGVREVHDLASLLTSLGRLTGMLGTYLALVQLLLLTRVPGVERALGVRRLGAVHRRNGRTALALLVAHTVLIAAGYALEDEVALPDEVSALLGDYEGVLLATIGLGLLVAVVVTSATAARRRLGARAWRAIHVTAYAALVLAFSHELATGHEFQQQPVARAYWWALYGVVAAVVVGSRVLVPAWRAVRS